ncbi:MAG: hypothetical protein JNK53_06610, partial [Phycisphaerae bacterium]|nr:hypothetical protein [Phycisphaerae bacterium]
MPNMKAPDPNRALERSAPAPGAREDPSSVVARNRCAGCAYPIDGLPGVPSQPYGVFTRNVTCPECGLTMAEGSLVLVGATAVDDLRKQSPARRIVRFALSQWLFLLVAAVLGPGIVMRFWNTGTVSWGVRLVVFAVLSWGFAVGLIRLVRSIRSAGDGSDELAGAVAG